ncbi:hypothetical protein CGGC5_v017027 [Colletotrichum fructicola Nara gc5]|uniref:Nucleic-acid-binding protein from transposon X-element n=1 Tax=Colletotrichum fructicola (strain Nara gc5) TaxID=1213859 RepID=A0A7J6IDG7_COLFN|nr:hypothetical protein CGGC5_v017027 [Colletotrichum fructicola Nara gc5]
MASQPAAGPSQGPNGLISSIHNLPKTPPPPTSLPPRPRGLTPPPIWPLGRGPQPATAALQQAREGRALRDEALNLLAKGLDALIGTAPARLKATAQDLIDSFTRFATAEISGPTPTPGPGKTYAQAVGGSTAGGPLSGPGPGPRPSRTTGRQPTNYANKPKQTQDLRLLVRLPAEHIPTSRSLAPHSVKMVVTKELNLQPQDLVEVRHTATGFSLRPQNKEIQALLLQRAPEIKNCLTAEKVEVPTRWYQYSIPFCPLYFTSLDGSKVGIESEIEEEVLLRTKQRLLSWRPTRDSPNLATATQSLIIALPQEVKEGFRLFGQSGPARLLPPRKRTPKRHSPGCQGFHSDRFCTRQALCENCSKPLGTHEAGPCLARPKCANCYGPFPASHTNCPARPLLVNGKLVIPTYKELRGIRKVGGKASDDLLASQTCSLGSTQQAEARPGATSKRPRPLTPTQDSIVVADTASITGSSSSMDEDEAEDSEALPLTNRPIRPLPSSSRSQRVTQKPDYNVINAYTHLDLDSEQ